MVRAEEGEPSQSSLVIDLSADLSVVPMTDVVVEEHLEKRD